MNGDIRKDVGGDDHIRHLPVAARSLGRKAHRHHRPHSGREIDFGKKMNELSPDIPEACAAARGAPGHALILAR